MGDSELRRAHLATIYIGDYCLRLGELAAMRLAVGPDPMPMPAQPTDDEADHIGRSVLRALTRLATAVHFNTPLIRAALPQFTAARHSTLVGWGGRYCSSAHLGLLDLAECLWDGLVWYGCMKHELSIIQFEVSRFSPPSLQEPPPGAIEVEPNMRWVLPHPARKRRPRRRNRKAGGPLGRGEKAAANDSRLSPESDEAEDQDPEKTLRRAVGRRWPTATDWLDRGALDDCVARLSAEAEIELASALARLAAGAPAPPVATKRPKGKALEAQAQALAIQHPDWTLAEIARHLGVHRSTVSRMSFVKVLRQQQLDARDSRARGHRTTTGSVEGAAPWKSLYSPDELEDLAEQLGDLDSLESDQD